MTTRRSSARRWRSVESRGKWLLIHFSGGGTLATHMLMSGSWHIYRHGERWQQPRIHMRIVIENSDYMAVGFRVPVARDAYGAIAGARRSEFRRRQMDVLSAEFDAEAAARACWRTATRRLPMCCCIRK